MRITLLNQYLTKLYLNSKVLVTERTCYRNMEMFVRRLFHDRLAVGSMF